MSPNKNISRAPACRRRCLQSLLDFASLFEKLPSPVVRHWSLRLYCVRWVCLHNMGEGCACVFPANENRLTADVTLLSPLSQLGSRTPRCSPLTSPLHSHRVPTPAAATGHTRRLWLSRQPHPAWQPCYWTRPSGLAPSPPIPAPQQWCLPATFVSAVRTRSKHVTLTSPRRVVFQRRYQDRDGLPRRRTAKPVFHEYSVNLLKL